MKNNQPLITIITVVYNGEKHLEQTIQSVIGQNYENVEYIIIDGGSTDRTLDIVKKYEDHIDYWVSEPDEGIYDAMNKGISIAKGEWINFMNADDWFVDNTLHLVAEATQNENPQYIFGDINKVFEDGTIKLHKGSLSNWKVHAPVCHQALFVKTDVLKRLPFDRQYNIMADYNQMIHLIKEGLPYSVIDGPLANFRLGGFSTVEKTKDRERFKLQLHHFGLFWATTSFLRQTKKPIIYHSVRGMAKIKNLWLSIRS